MTLNHGGQLQQIAEHYQIPPSDWLDVSTGISPLSFPISQIPLTLWQQLPQQNDALIDAAKQYYQCNSVMVTNGSQSIIKAIPELWKGRHVTANKVYLPAVGYKEHQLAWDKAGYQLCYYHDELPALGELTQYSVLVVINPNNPTGQLFNKETLIKYQQVLQEREALLVVDEAFMDVVTPEQSMCSFVDNNNILVLRSFGKFFGLAGIRIGFLVASPKWLEVFSDFIGPWQVNGPAQFIAQQALNDVFWHKHQQQKLSVLCVEQEEIIRRALGKELVKELGGTSLFLSVYFHQHNIAIELHHLLCKQGVYSRLTDEQDALRFGITNKENFSRLSLALEKAKQGLTGKVLSRT